MSFPEKYKYTKDHEWIAISGSEGTVGITTFAQSELGEVVFIDLPAVGTRVTKGKPLCVVESTKAASDVYAPLSGVVIEVNSDLANDPAALNNDPHGEGWLVKLGELATTEESSLMDATAYQSHVGK